MKITKLNRWRLRAGDVRRPHAALATFPACPPDHAHHHGLIVGGTRSAASAPRRGTPDDRPAGFTTRLQPDCGRVTSIRAISGTD
jgi:hypothetical protein